MNTLRHNFNNIVAPKAAKTAPPPFSLQLTFEECQRLEAGAGDMPLEAFIRQRLLGDIAALHADLLRALGKMPDDGP